MENPHISHGDKKKKKKTKGFKAPNLQSTILDQST